MNYWNDRIKAIGYALKGLRAAFKRETHLRIHVFAALLVLNLSAFFRVSAIEWIVLILCCALVISLELINSALERLCDKVSEENNSEIKYVKDVAAAAVLVAAVAALFIGFIIFRPYITEAFK